MSTPALQRFPSARALVVAVVAAVAGLVLAAAPAQAHDRLVGSSPAADQAVDVAPDQLVLSFSNEPLELGSSVAVRDASGADLAVGPPLVSGRDVSVALPVAPAGAYTVVWRVVSQDGHPIEGTFGFTVTTGAAPSPTETTTTEPTTTGPEATTTEPSAPPTSIIEDVTPPTDPGSGGVPAWVLALVAVVAVGGVVALLITRRRQGPPGGPPAS